MNRRETFIITLFCDPDRDIAPRGRLRHVATNRETTFKNLQELPHLLNQFVKGEAMNHEDEKEIS